MKLNDVNVMITGAGGGIGRHIASAFASKGANLSLVDLSEEALAPVLEMASDKGVKAVGVVADITKDEDIKRAVRETKAAIGSVGVLVNNAGVMPFKTALDHSSSDIMAALMVNVYGPMRLIQAVLPGMIESGTGRVVNIGSTFGSLAFPYFSVYSATKSAMRSFSEALRRELQDHKGVGVTYIAPRAVRSTQSPVFFEMAKKMKMKLDEPSDVAAVIVRAVEKGESEVYLGGSEKLFMFINKFKPTMIDGGLKKQIGIMEEYSPKMQKK